MCDTHLYNKLYIINYMKKICGDKNDDKNFEHFLHIKI